MATPTPVRPNAASTPKTNLAGTPTRILASPRPGVTSAPRPFAGKSPAVKTPASLSHSHNVSTSSHPSSTPLAAPNVPDEVLGFSSPSAALIASLGGSGLTPLANGHDGLGITNLLPNRTMAGAPAQKNPEVEKLRHLQDVVNMVRTRMADRGITREGIERLAQLNGFELLPEEENVTIAGHHCVDLEISFDPANRDLVKNATLKLNMLGPGEDPEFQKEASDVLRRDLEGGSTTGGAPWSSLDGFATNLEYLGQLDRLSSSVNCFAAASGLFKCFRSIWDEEKKRMSWRSELQQLCKGTTGRPRMDNDKRLGFSVDYWAINHEINLFEPKTSSTSWSASVSCDAGTPSITKSTNWLSPEVLVAEETLENTSDQQRSFRPDWQSGAKDDANAVESLETLLEPTNVRFTCNLDPPILFPLSTILALNANGHAIEVNQTDILTYEQALEHQRLAAGMAPVAMLRPNRYTRNFPVFDTAGQAAKREHSYAIYSTAPLWCYSTDKLIFSHPRQLADALPMLRQFALLWTLLRTITPGRAETSLDASSAAITNGTEQSARTSRPQKRNNQSLKKAKLDALLAVQRFSEDITNVDVTLDGVTDPSKVRLNLIVPLSRPPYFLSLMVDVAANGSLQANSITEGLATDEMRRKMTRVIELSEDLGVLVEWALERLKDRQKSQ